MADREIDPRFFLPPNVIDLNYSDKTLPSSDAPDATVVEGSLSDANDIEDISTPGGESILPPPDSVTFVSQTVKVTSGGTVVDVVIDVEEISGVTQFEVRITK